MKTAEKIERLAEICAAKSGYVKSDRERLEVTPWYIHNVFMKGFLKGYKATLQNTEVKITDSKQGWVSVEDMPKKATYYLICQKRDFDGYILIDIAYYNGVQFVFSSEQPYDINNEFWKVTHWMPLPAPPTEEPDTHVTEIPKEGETKKRWLMVQGMITEIPAGTDTSEEFEIDFGSSCRFLIGYEGKNLCILNGVNGYGDNCKEEFQNEIPVILVEETVKRSEPDIVEEEFEQERLLVAKTEKNVEVIADFIEHCKNEGLDIPDKYFESFFGA